MTRTPADARVVALTHAFMEDPLVAFLCPDLRTRAALLHVGMSFMLGLGSNYGGEVGVVRHAGTCAGAIVSFEPHRYPVPWIGAGIEGLKALRFLPLLPRGWVPWRSGWLGFRLLAYLEKLHPQEPHWYILVIGVDPEFQGTGKGAELFAPVLHRADREKQLVYLESSNPKNLSFYQRQGFRVVSEERPVPGCPPIFPMVRSPV